MRFVFEGSFGGHAAVEELMEEPIIVSFRRRRCAIDWVQRVSFSRV